MKQLIGIFAVMIGFLLTPPAIADDLIISRAMLEDATGALTITDVAGREFKPVGPLLSEGYSDSAYWLRLQIKRPAHGSEVVIHIGSAFLDDVRLYESVDGKPLEWLTRVTGDQYPYEERDRIAIALGFEVNVTAPEKTYYLRIKTTSASLLNVEALEPREAQRRELKSDLLRNIFMGLMLWSMMWAIDHYLVDRQAAVGMFGLYQAVYILYGLSATGNFAPFVPPGCPQLANWLTSILACGAPFAFLLFSRSLFKLYAPPAALMRGFGLLLLAFPIPMAAMILGHTRAALAINGIISLAAIWYCVIVAFSAGRELVPSRRLLQGVYVALALVGTESIFADFGWMTATQASVNSDWMLIAHGIVTSGLISILLFMRLRQLRHDAQESAVALALSQQALAIERTHREKAQTHARTDYLTGISNRRHFVELVGHELARAVRHQEPLSLLMIDIDHFKSVNDKWGHHGGDLVLQKIAHLIRDTLREVDIFGRMGGEEFAAALIGIDTDQALEVAQRLRVTVENTAIALPDGQHVRITLSVGLAALKESDFSLDSLLHKADKALYRAKQSGRNCVMANT